MNITGIIVEYNPFHNGHLYHIQKTKELTKPDLLIAVMSGSYVQRGEVSIIDKYEKTRLALENGIDLVIELPYQYATQNANIFAYGAINILNTFKVDSICFGSETNNLEELKVIASTSINPDHLKEMMDDGLSYPKAYGLLSDKMLPNDILAVAYLKELAKTNIKPYSIARTNMYHDLKMDTIASASAIRKAIKNGEEYKNSTKAIIDKPVFNDDFYDYLRKILFSFDRKELSKLHLINEGIEKVFIDNAYRYDHYEDFIEASISKRYTRSRIQRCLINIFNHVTKEKMQDLVKTPYYRVLGFNAKGQAYLAQNKDIPYITQFKKLDDLNRNFVYHIESMYASLFDEEKRKDLLIKELRGPIRY